MNPNDTNAAAAADRDRMLDQWESARGPWDSASHVAQALRRSLREGPGWLTAPAAVREGLDRIVLPLERIVSGGGRWRDPALYRELGGFAALLERYVERKEYAVRDEYVREDAVQADRAETHPIERVKRRIGVPECWIGTLAAGDGRCGRASKPVDVWEVDGFLREQPFVVVVATSETIEMAGFQVEGSNGGTVWRDMLSPEVATLFDAVHLGSSRVFHWEGTFWSTHVLEPTGTLPRYLRISARELKAGSVMASAFPGRLWYGPTADAGEETAPEPAGTVTAESVLEDPEKLAPEKELPSWISYKPGRTSEGMYVMQLGSLVAGPMNRRTGREFSLSFEETFPFAPGDYCRLVIRTGSGWTGSGVQLQGSGATYEDDELWHDMIHRTGSKLLDATEASGNIAETNFEVRLPERVRLAVDRIDSGYVTAWLESTVHPKELPS